MMAKIPGMAGTIEAVYQDNKVTGMLPAFVDPTPISHNSYKGVQTQLAPAKALAGLVAL